MIAIAVKQSVYVSAVCINSRIVIYIDNILWSIIVILCSHVQISCMLEIALDDTTFEAVRNRE